MNGVCLLSPHTHIIFVNRLVVDHLLCDQKFVRSQQTDLVIDTFTNTNNLIRVVLVR